MDEVPSGQEQGPTSPARRVVTRWEIVALSLNDVSGSGVYLLPASAAVLGPASPLAVAFAGFAVGALVFPTRRRPGSARA